MNEQFDTLLQQRTDEIVQSHRDLLRDEFATAALMGFLANGDEQSASAIARRCYTFADAMLDARAAGDARR